MACIEEERKKAFVVFASTYKSAVKYLTLEQMGELFLKLGKYSFEGESVSSDNPLIDTLLTDAMPNMDAAERRHKAAIENGKKGKDKGGGIGAPRKSETKEEYQARLLEWKRNRDDGNNPQEPLNKDIDTNIDRDTDNKKEIDIERYKDTDVKINANNSVMTNSVYTNQVSFSNSLKPVLGNTKEGEEPTQEKTQHHVSSSNSKSEDENTYHETDQDEEDDYQFKNLVVPVPFGAPSYWLNHDPNDLPPLYDEEQTPSPVECQQEVANVEDAPSKRSERYELIALINDRVAAAAECKEQGGKMNDYMPILRQARDAYMELHNCEKDKAQEEISWKFHCANGDLQRKREIADRINKPR